MKKSDYIKVRDAYFQLVTLILFNSDTVILMQDTKMFPNNVIEKVPNLISIFSDEEKEFSHVVSLLNLVNGNATIKDFETIVNSKEKYQEKVAFLLLKMNTLEGDCI